MGHVPLWSVAQRPLRVGPRVWVRASGCGARLGIRPNRRGEEDRGKAGRPPEGKRRRGSSRAPPATRAGRSCPYGGEQKGGVARTVRRGGRSEAGARWWGFRGGGVAREAGGGHGEGHGTGQEWAQGAGRRRGGRRGDLGGRGRGHGREGHGERDERGERRRRGRDGPTRLVSRVPRARPVRAAHGGAATA